MPGSRGTALRDAVELLGLLVLRATLEGLSASLVAHEGLGRGRFPGQHAAERSGESGVLLTAARSLSRTV